MSNLLLLPTTRKQWEENAKTALQRKEYAQAKSYYQSLVDHEVHSYTNHVNLLVCCMKLYQFQEAEQYCEFFMDYYRHTRYVEFLEFYIMILYESQQFPRVMNVIQEALDQEKLPEKIEQKFQEIYSICYELNKPMEQALLTMLDEAIQAENHQKQWRHLHEWLQLGMKSDERIACYLENPSIHPVLKTKILEKLLTDKYIKLINIEKFGLYRNLRPNQLLSIKEEMQYNTLVLKVQSIEQDNPTLYELVKELMYQYCYVMYPFSVHQKNIKLLTTAFTQVGRQHLGLEKENHIYNEEVKIMMKNIELCSQLYTNITVL